MRIDGICKCVCPVRVDIVCCMFTLTHFLDPKCNCMCHNLVNSIFIHSLLFSNFIYISYVDICRQAIIMTINIRFHISIFDAMGFFTPSNPYKVSRILNSQINYYKVRNRRIVK